MKKISIWKGGLLGLVTGVLVILVATIGFALFGLPFPPFDTFDWMARQLPGDLITFGIDSMVAVIARLNIGPTADVAKFIEQGMAIGQFLVGGFLLGLVTAAVARGRPENAPLIGAGFGFLATLATLAVEISLGLPAVGPMISVLWLGFLFIGWGALLGRLIQFTAPVSEPGEEQRHDRRRFLYLVGAGSFTVLVSALGVTLLKDENGETQAAEPSLGGTGGPAESPPEDVLAQRFEPVPGTRPEITSNADFYRIDINTIAPSIDGDSWEVVLGGLVDNPVTLNLDRLRSYPAVSQAITQECISNRIGGDLISTAVYTGVQLKTILEEAGLQPEASVLYIESADGFYETVIMDDMFDERTLLVYEMNGVPLPREHGFPLRIYIPNRFGMKQPKWIIHMEIIDEDRMGYWVERGWDAAAIVKTMSVIDTVYQSEEDTNSVLVGGIAFAGAREISKVEVQVDDGAWQEAELRAPAVSPLTWVQWRYMWPAQEGRHTFRVRAYDGTGELQQTEVSAPHPSGATGIHSVTE
jgi:DMSO/TMAO reductase YedYZ molybdopterin-dependent catalytic subunit